MQNLSMNGYILYIKTAYPSLKLFNLIYIKNGILEYYQIYV